MEKYHIYEEIGKGEFSQVFKGREKKRIEYVAIKRIEKSVMNKVWYLVFNRYCSKFTHYFYCKIIFFIRSSMR